MNDNDSISWRAIYEQNNQVRRLVDRIHDSRMLPPPTCDQCIEIAVSQLKKSMLGIGQLVRTAQAAQASLQVFFEVIG